MAATTTSISRRAPLSSLVTDLPVRPGPPRSRRRCTANREAVALFVLQGKPQFQGDLPVGYLSTLDVTPGIQHLEPTQVAHGLGGLRNRLLHRVFHTASG